MVLGLFRKKEPAKPVSAPAIEEQHIEINGLKISYLQAGPEDKTVVFIHGNSACKEAFKHQFGTLLENGIGFVALDLPGHGTSVNALTPQTEYTIPAYADLVARLCEKLGLDRPLLCGWSLGGHIAIEMAGSHSDYSGLMIFGTPPVGPGVEHLETAFLPADVSDVTGAEAPPKDRLEAYIKALYGTLYPIPDNLVDAGLRADGRSRSNMFAHWASGQSGHNQRQVIADWRGPLLIVHGTDDPFISGDYIKGLEMSGDGSGAIFKDMKGIGHAPFIEAPSDFNQILLEFCKKSFASSGSDSL